MKIAQRKGGHEDQRRARAGTGRSGTPSGEVFRRYWLPVEVSANLGGGRGGNQSVSALNPIKVTMLNEHLLLFRGSDGAPHLLDEHCSHRGTSLFYGRVEGDCIRCLYHGWLYDGDGNVVEMPGEPPDSRFHEKVHHTAYPCIEVGGLIFAYMGPPALMPVFPKYHRLFSDDGVRVLGNGGYTEHCNVFQALHDNNLDPWHGEIALKVMLLTPAFRNMDLALEEAARIGGATTLRTMLRITIPLMASPIILVFALQLLRIFQSFETEFLLGRPIQFYVYSTLIYDYIRAETPNYGAATTLASMTLLIILVIVPMQRWVLNSRRYTTITGSFKSGLIDVGAWKWLVFGAILFLHLTLTLVQLAAFVLASVMTRAGFFGIRTPFTWGHWRFVYSDGLFLGALQTTLVLAMVAAVMSPLLFSVLAYIMVRTKWPGRALLDWMIWSSGAIPGLLSGLGPPVPVSRHAGPVMALRDHLCPVARRDPLGKHNGREHQQGGDHQVGFDLEEAARISGAGWLRTYWKIWLPVLMPTMILLGTLNFVGAAGATSSVILLASGETITLSILALEFASPELAMREAAGIVTLRHTSGAALERT